MSPYTRLLHFKMAISSTLACILGVVFYIIFLGVGVAGLVVYNIWNNRELQKAREERCRDSLMDALNDEKMWRDSKATMRSSNLPVDTYDSQVGSKPKCSKVSFEDSLLSIDSLGDIDDSLSTIRSENPHDSMADFPHELASMSHNDEENGQSRGSSDSTLALSKLDVSALTDSGFENAMRYSVSLDTFSRKNDSNNTFFEHVKTGRASTEVLIEGGERRGDYQVMPSAQPQVFTEGRERKRSVSRHSQGSMDEGERSISIYSQDSMDEGK